MIRLMVFTIIFWSPWAWSSEAKESLVPVSIKKGVIVESAKNYKLPEELVAQLEHYFLQSYREADPVRTGLMKDHEILLKLRRISLNAEITLEPIDRAVLKEPVLFKFPLGGGGFNLDGYIKSSSEGEFKMLFKISLGERAPFDQSELDRGLQVYFISQAKKREGKKQELGSGCNQFMKITSFYKKQIKPQGLQLTTKNLSHISTTAGFFIFTYAHEENLYIATIKVSAPSHPRLLC